MEQVRVIVQAPDPVSHAGLASFLEATPEIRVLCTEDGAGADVLLLCCGQLTPDVVAILRRSAATTGLPVVLVIDGITDSELLTAVECRVVGIMPRGAVSAARLGHSVLSAAKGGGVMPPNLVGELLRHIDRLQREVLAPSGLNASGLTPREIDVLRLMADGMDTHEIAGELCYSERTVKNVIYGLTSRLKLRNRTHAVAYALRGGVIWLAPSRGARFRGFLAERRSAPDSNSAGRGRQRPRRRQTGQHAAARPATLHRCE